MLMPPLDDYAFSIFMPRFSRRGGTSTTSQQATTARHNGNTRCPDFLRLMLHDATISDYTLISFTLIFATFSHASSGFFDFAARHAATIRLRHTHRFSPSFRCVRQQ